MGNEEKKEDQTVLCVRPMQRTTNRKIAKECTMHNVVWMAAMKPKRNGTESASNISNT